MTANSAHKLTVLPVYDRVEDEQQCRARAGTVVDTDAVVTFSRLIDALAQSGVKNAAADAPWAGSRFASTAELAVVRRRVVEDARQATAPEHKTLLMARGLPRLLSGFFDACAEGRVEPTELSQFVRETPQTSSRLVLLAELYQEVSSHAVTAVDGRDCFYPCPRCRWPMKVTETQVRCASSSPCRQAGATFARSDDGLLALGKLPAPDPVPVAGWAALRQGVWRYTTLPGLEELDLERRLVKLGADVELWPYVDRYDLDVRRGGQHWRVDVKDHASVPRLARHLADRPASESIWIVVPDSKRDQVPMLRSLVPPELGYRFASSSEFSRLVEAAP